MDNWRVKTTQPMPMFWLLVAAVLAAPEGTCLLLPFLEIKITLNLHR